MKTYRYEIVRDDHPESPREWDNMGKMVCWHGRYKLGDEQPDCSPADYQLRLAHELDDDLQRRLGVASEWYDRKYKRDWISAETAEELYADYESDAVQKVLDKHLVMIPLYLLDHSGISISTAPFSCRWDSGRVGFIYAKKGTEGMTDADLEQVLRSEVETYDQYLTGDVWGYRVFCNETDEVLDSCWGFFGADNCIYEAQSVVEYYTKREQEQDLFTAKEFAK